MFRFDPAIEGVGRIIFHFIFPKAWFIGSGLQGLSFSVRVPVYSIRMVARMQDKENHE